MAGMGGHISIQKGDLGQWSKFWKQGYITTFGASKKNNYDGVVRDFWREKFLDLAAGSHVLDIATGNGAIAMLAAEVAKESGKNLAISATDLAAINNNVSGDDNAVALRSNIKFRSHTPCEKQPFQDDSVDLVTSQFGFEYSDITKTIAEARRILKPGGQFIAISHHAESALIKAATIELQVYAYALGELDIFAVLRKLFDALGTLDGTAETLKGASAKAKPHSKEVNDVMNRFRSRYPTEECAQEIVGAVGHLAQGAAAVGHRERLAAIDLASDDFRCAEARLKDMVGAALDQDEIDGFTLVARELGFSSVHCLTLYGGDSVLAGWQIHLK
jgi:SAM-dependent methyltransferase